MKRLCFFVAVSALYLAAGPAFALSCMPANGASLYIEARDSSEAFAIVKGRLSSTPPITVPQVSDRNPSTESPRETTRVRMTGVVLGEEDFGAGFDRQIDVTVTCASVWCGQPQTDTELLAALRLTGATPELSIGPCGGHAVPATPDNIDALLECHRNGVCQTFPR